MAMFCGLTPGRNLPVQPDHHNKVERLVIVFSEHVANHGNLTRLWTRRNCSGYFWWEQWELPKMGKLGTLRDAEPEANKRRHVFNGPLAILHTHIDAGWWFQTFLELSIS